MDDHTPAARLDLSDGDAAMTWTAALALHERWLRRLVAVRVGEPQATDDVMQEVALAAAGQNGRLVTPANAAGWLYRVAVRQALLYRRRCGRRRKLLERAADREPTRETTDPLSWLLLEERHALLREALGRLPSRDMDVLVLKYAEGWSYRQIAEHLDTTVSAVETRLHRARKRLRSALQQRNINEASP